MLLAALLFQLLASGPAHAQPEWIGAGCYDSDFRGRKSQVELRDCRELFPTEFRFDRCSCTEYTPQGAALGAADNSECGGAPPDDCAGDGQGGGGGGSQQISRPDFLPAASD